MITPHDASLSPVIPTHATLGRNEALGLTAALLAAGSVLRHGLYQATSTPVAGGATVLGLVALSLVVHRRTKPLWWVTILTTLGVAGIVLIGLAGLDQFLILTEPRIAPLGFVARMTAPILQVAGFAAVAESGSLGVSHPDGFLAILPSPEKVGLRGFVTIWVVWVFLQFLLNQRRLGTLAGVGACVLGVVALIRFELATLLYLESTHILSVDGGYDGLSWFSGPAVTGFTMIVSGLLLDLVSHRLLVNVPQIVPGSPDYSSLPVRQVAMRIAVATGLGLLVGLTGTLEPPGKLKAGRILIDDRFCGVWEPTARLLDTKWYGDFSTYSFSSLAEWLGHWYSVDVNTNRTYTDEILSHYDILILKTPSQPISEIERQAIDRFVTAGGGLLLVGDHTNLLGSGTHLNTLCSRYGIRFRYDSVSDASTGGFVDYYGPAVGRNIGSIDVDHLQFMTSCSLELGPNASSVVVAPSCRRDPQDYAGSSFFGRVGPHPEMAHGPMVLAAVTPAGRGKIAAFTDSTVWSSFALFQFDRDRLAANLIAVLNHESGHWTWPLRIVAIMTLGLGLMLSKSLIRQGRTVSFSLAGMIGIMAGLFAADQCHRRFYEVGPPRSPVGEVAFLWQGGQCAFPPVLGNVGSLPLDQAFDTLLVAVQRVGLVPRVAYTYESDLFTSNTRAVVVIAPVVVPPQATLVQIQSFVQAGGSLIVLDDGRLQGGGSAPAFLKPFNVDLHYTAQVDAHNQMAVRSVLTGLAPLGAVPAPETFVAHTSFGRGHVIYMSDAIQYSRKELGHCFSRPGRVARSRYETVFWVFRDVLGVSDSETERRLYGFTDKSYRIPK